MTTAQPAEDLITSGMLVFGGSANFDNVVRGIAKEDTGIASGRKVEFMAGRAGVQKTSLALLGVQTLSGTATPSVRGAEVFKTTGTTPIDDFDDGEVGQTIKILATANITITNNAAILLAGSVNFDMKVATTDTLTLTMFDDQVWSEVSRSVN